MYKMNEKDGGDGKEVEKRKRRSDLLHFLFLFDVVSCVLSHSISSAPVAAWCVFDVTLYVFRVADVQLPGRASQVPRQSSQLAVNLFSLFFLFCFWLTTPSCLLSLWKYKDGHPTFDCDWIFEFSREENREN